MSFPVQADDDGTRLVFDNDMAYNAVFVDGDIVFVDYYAFANDGTDVVISYNYLDQGTMNVITLTGVVSSDAMVYDLASFTDVTGSSRGRGIDSSRVLGGQFFQGFSEFFNVSGGETLFIQRPGDGPFIDCPRSEKLLI